MLDDVLDRLVDHLVEGLGVFTELLSRARERLGDAGSELGFQHRQRPFAHAHPGEAIVGVVRVVPDLKSGCCAELPRDGAPHAQERSKPADAVLVLAQRRHPLQAGRPGAAGETEQHGLGLVVESVPQKDGLRSGILRLLTQHPVPGLSRRCLGTAVGVDAHRRDGGVQSEGGRTVGDERGDLRGPVLQLVIDDQRGGAESELWRLEGGRRGEGEGVGPAGEGDEHESVPGEIGEGGAHGEADLGDGGVQRWHITTVGHAGRLVPGIQPTFSRSTRMGAHDAVIEIPRGSRVKYEVDHETGRVHLDRVLYTTFGYPADYGYFDNTLGEDGDPLDVLVLLDHAIYPGVVVEVRPVAVLKMSDEAGGDDKLVAVLSKDPRWAHIQDIDDIAEYTKKEIAHFFEHYKDLEPNKWVKVDAWGDKAEAERILDEAIVRFGEQAH